VVKRTGGEKTPVAGFPALKPGLFLLLAVLANGECHAYALKKEVARRSQGRVSLGPGTLHRYLNKLIQDGWIAHVESPLPVHLDDERRRYYSLTSDGRQGLAAAAETQLRLAQEVQRSLAPEGKAQ